MPSERYKMAEDEANRRVAWTISHRSTELDLSELRIRDLPDLSGLGHLMYLNLNGCKHLRTLEPIATLPALQELYLNECDLPNIEPVARLAQLRRLSLDRSNILDGFSPLASLSLLEELWLSGCTLNSLEPFAGLKNLTLLDLSFSVALSLAPLAELPGLKALHLRGCQDRELLASLSQLSSLRELDVSRSDLRSLEPLCQLTQLESLNLFLSLITDLGGLTCLKELRTLNLGGCQMTDLEPLRSLNSLRQLQLNGCTAVKSLEPLVNLKLEWLDISGCEEVDNLAPLASLTELKHLECVDIPIRTHNEAVKIITGLPKLEFLSIYHFKTAPGGILSKNQEDNCWPELSEWIKAQP